MSEGTIALTVMTGLLLITFGGFLVWGIRSGQFKNIEEAKFQIFKPNREIDDVSKSPEKQNLEGERGEEE